MENDSTTDGDRSKSTSVCCQSNASNTNKELVVTTTVDPNSLYYDMSHNNKQGLAYIFSHENFETKNVRKAADVESRKLKNCLIKLRFDVHPFKDLKFEEIKDHIKEAQTMNHKDTNCLLIAIMSHGGPNEISAYDKCYDPQTVILEPFSAHNCPSLAGKPKLFFIQSCRGNKLDSGVKMQMKKVTETDGSTEYKIPIYSDFCVMYSTAKDHFAFCNEIKGSFFIDVLCQELEKHAYREHLLTILTFVNRRVAIEFQSKSKFVAHNQKKQIPFFECSLTRLLKFEDKGDKRTEEA